MRRASVLMPRSASQQSNGPGTAPAAFCRNRSRAAIASSLVTTTPPTMSLCPFRYLVLECTHDRRAQRRAGAGSTGS